MNIDSGTPPLGSSFDDRESDRRRRRVASLDTIAQQGTEHARASKYYRSEVARLIGSLVTPVTRLLEVGCGPGDLLASVAAHEKVGLDVSPSMIDLARKRHPDLDLRVVDVERDPLPDGPFDIVVLSDVVGLLDDIHVALERIRNVLAPAGRLIVTYYNFVWHPPLRVAEWLGLKTAWPGQNWLGMQDVRNLIGLAGFEVVREGTDVLLPLRVPGVSSLANRVGAKLPGLRHVALTSYFVARAVDAPVPEPLPGVSVICPCKNERGNIRDAVARTPQMGPVTELIFVDGNSTDGTPEEIQAVMAEYTGPLKLILVPQGDGKGKGDALRKGFAAATQEVLMILDSDLTVPPEDLPKFYRALVTNKGEFINGVRLVYPMEGQAMRFLNLLGNKFFSAALSWLLEQAVKDSLCGTKVLRKRDYDRIAANRNFFGESDPFGDFDLLFGAARLNLRILDLPVRYRARTYGDTKISRFSHGWLLLKMTGFGFRKLRLG